MILSIEDSVAASHRTKFRRLFVVTMILVTLLYVSFGVAGFLSYGLETSPIITTNLPHGTGMRLQAVVCLSFFVSPFSLHFCLLSCNFLHFLFPNLLFMSHNVVLITLFSSLFSQTLFICFLYSSFHSLSVKFPVWVSVFLFIFCNTVRTSQHNSLNCLFFPGLPVKLIFSF